MTRPRLVALLATVLLAVAPAAPAVAQSAGDDQYSDPFAGSTTPAPKPKPQATTAPPVAAPAPATAAPAPAAATQQGGPVAQASGAPAPAGSALAQTGADVWKVALLGLALVLGGVALRLRTADGRG